MGFIRKTKSLLCYGNLQLQCTLKKTNNNNNNSSMKVFTIILLLIALNCYFFINLSASATPNDFGLLVSERESLIASSNITTLDKIKEQYINILTDAKLKLSDVEKTKLMKQNELEIILTVYSTLSNERKAEADIFIKKVQSQLSTINSIANELQFKIDIANSAIIKIEQAISKIIGGYTSPRFAFSGAPNVGIEGLLMVNSNSTIYGIGYNQYGNLGCGNNNNPVTTPCKTIAEAGVLGGKGVSLIKSKYHTVVLTTDNSLITFGHGLYGSLGNGKLVDSNVPVLVDNTLFKGKTIKQVEVGALSTIIVTTDDKMYGWGYSGYWEFCMNGVGKLSTPIALPTFPKKLKKVVYKNSASVFIAETGEVYYCGKLMQSSSTETAVSTYTKIDTSAMGTDFIEDVAFLSYSIIYRTASGNLYGMGQNGNFELGLGDSIARTQPTLISYFKNNGIFITKVCSDTAYTVYALSKEGKVYVWGTVTRKLPYRYINNEIDKYNIVDIYCGVKAVIAVSDNGIVFGWGDSSLFGNNNALEPMKIENPLYY